MSESCDEFDLYAAVGERQAEVSEYLGQWVRLQTSSVPLDRNVVERAVSAVYRLHQMQSPTVVFCRSIWQVGALSLIWAATGNLSLVSDAASCDQFELAQQWRQLAADCHEQKLEPRFRARLTGIENAQEGAGFINLDGTTTLRSRFQKSASDLYESLSLKMFPASALGGLALITYEFNKLNTVTNHELIVRLRSLMQERVSFEVARDLWRLQEDREGQKKPMAAIDGSVSMWLSPWDIYKFLPYLVVIDIFEEQRAALFGEATIKELEVWRDLSRSAFGFLFLPQLCMVCERPEKLSTDEFGRLHGGDGPGIVFGDGYKQYYVRGISLDGRIVENPESITVSEIETEENAEVRRLLIERYGLERFIRDSGAIKINEDESGVLYRKELANDEPLVVVMVRNSTSEPDGSFKHYFLRVPPTMETANQAVAWTFRMVPGQYAPQVET